MVQELLASATSTFGNRYLEPGARSPDTRVEHPTGDATADELLKTEAADALVELYLFGNQDLGDGLWKQTTWPRGLSRNPECFGDLH